MDYPLFFLKVCTVIFLGSYLFSFQATASTSFKENDMYALDHVMQSIDFVRIFDITGRNKKILSILRCT